MINRHTPQSSTATYHVFALFILILTILILLTTSLTLRTLSTSLPSPIAPHAGIHKIRSNYSLPLNTTLNLAAYPTNFTQGIRPLPLQSHNDFERPIPLFDALSVGCTAFAADLVEPSISSKRDQTNGGGGPNPLPLFVSHSAKAVSEAFTLQNLYINPLLTILEHANAKRGVFEPMKGVYEDEPMRSVVLMLDFKTVPRRAMWDAVVEAVRPLAERGFLTFWSGEGSCEICGGREFEGNCESTTDCNDTICEDGSNFLDFSTIRTKSPVTGKGTLHIRPLTVVGTGSTPFPLIVHSSPNTTYRHIFMDAPLLSFLPSHHSDPNHPSPPPNTNTNKHTNDTSLSQTPPYTYDTSTTYSATAPLFHPLISLSNPLPLILGLATTAQRLRIRLLNRLAEERGLRSRFWGVKGLPVSRRAVWSMLVEERVGLLVVDEVGVVSGCWRRWGWWKE